MKKLLVYPVVMKTFYLLILALMLTACGSAEDGMEAGPPGIFPPQSIKKAETLKSLYEETQECTGLKGEAFESLRIEIVSELPCSSDPQKKCSGRFTTPNKFLITHDFVLIHETIHYLLWLNEGDADNNHDGRFSDLERCIF